MKQRNTRQQYFQKLLEYCKSKKICRFKTKYFRKPGFKNQMDKGIYSDIPLTRGQILAAIRHGHQTGKLQPYGNIGRNTWWKII